MNSKTKNQKAVTGDEWRVTSDEAGVRDAWRVTSDEGGASPVTRHPSPAPRPTSPAARTRSGREDSLAHLAFPASREEEAGGMALPRNAPPLPGALLRLMKARELVRLRLRRAGASASATDEEAGPAEIKGEVLPLPARHLRPGGQPGLRG